MVVELFLRVALLGLSLILAALTLAAYARVRSVKLLLIGGGFLVFAAKAGVLVLGIVDSEIYRAYIMSPELLAFDFAAIGLLYAGTTKT